MTTNKINLLWDGAIDYTYMEDELSLEHYKLTFDDLWTMVREHEVDFTLYELIKVEKDCQTGQLTYFYSYTRKLSSYTRMLDMESFFSKDTIQYKMRVKIIKKIDYDNEEIITLLLPGRLTHNLYSKQFGFRKEMIINLLGITLSEDLGII